MIYISHRSQEPCSLKPAIIIPDFTEETVCSLFMLLETGTTTVSDQTEKNRVQALQRLLGCGFSFQPRIKERWIVAKKVRDQVVYCTVQYCIVMYCIVRYCIVLYCIVLYCTILYCTVLYYTTVYSSVLHRSVLQYIVLYCRSVQKKG